MEESLKNLEEAIARLEATCRRIEIQQEEILDVLDKNGDI